MTRTQPARAMDGNLDWGGFPSPDRLQRCSLNHRWRTLQFPIGVVCLLLGLRGLKTTIDDYHLFISSSSGEVQAYTSKEKAQIERIVAAVNEAIVRCK